MSHREECHRKHIVKYAYSLSLEYIIMALIADVLYPKCTVDQTDVSRALNTNVAGARATTCKLGDALAVKAKILLSMEIAGGLESLASIQTCVLLSWREFGTVASGQYAATAAQLAVHFGVHLDPTNYGPSTKITNDEVNLRRLICWGVFIFDRYVT